MIIVYFLLLPSIFLVYGLLVISKLWIDSIVSFSLKLNIKKYIQLHGIINKYFFTSKIFNQ